MTKGLLSAEDSPAASSRRRELRIARRPLRRTHAAAQALGRLRCWKKAHSGPSLFDPVTLFLRMAAAPRRSDWQVLSDD